jgi:hypothetical protein
MFVFISYQFSEFIRPFYWHLQQISVPKQSSQYWAVLLTAFLCIHIYSVFHVENAPDIGGLRSRVSIFSEVEERDNSTVTMLKSSTTKRVPYGIVSVGSHSISCAMIFLFSALHVTLAGNGKFCNDWSILVLTHPEALSLSVTHTHTHTKCIKNINLEMNVKPWAQSIYVSDKNA